MNRRGRFSDELFNLITAIVFLALMILILSIVSCNTKKNEKETWNHGYCPYCEGKLVYEQAVGHKSKTGYIYKCQKCTRTYEFSKRMEFEPDEYFVYDTEITKTTTEAAR